MDPGTTRIPVTNLFLPLNDLTQASRQRLTQSCPEVQAGIPFRPLASSTLVILPSTGQSLRPADWIPSPVTGKRRLGGILCPTGCLPQLLHARLSPVSSTQHPAIVNLIFDFMWGPLISWSTSNADQPQEHNPLSQLGPSPFHPTCFQQHPIWHQLHMSTEDKIEWMVTQLILNPDPMKPTPAITLQMAASSTQARQSPSPETDRLLGRQRHSTLAAYLWQYRQATGSTRPHLLEHRRNRDRPNPTPNLPHPHRLENWTSRLHGQSRANIFIRQNRHRKIHEQFRHNPIKLQRILRLHAHCRTWKQAFFPSTRGSYRFQPYLTREVPWANPEPLTWSYGTHDSTMSQWQLRARHRSDRIYLRTQERTPLMRTSILTGLASGTHTTP